MNIYSHLARVTSVLEVGIAPEGFILIEELLEPVLAVVPPEISQGCTLMRKLITIKF